MQHMSFRIKRKEQHFKHPLHLGNWIPNTPSFSPEDSLVKIFYSICSSSQNESQKIKVNNGKPITLF